MGLLDVIEQEMQTAPDTPAAQTVTWPDRGKTSHDELIDGIRQGWPEGARNNGLSSLAGLLRKQGFNGDMIGAILGAVNKSTGMNLNEREVQVIARSISRYPAGQEIENESAGNEKKKIFTLPIIENSLDLSATPPELKPVLIDGILRKGHKMSLSAPSKAGKSFALINLALSFAYGIDWLGFICRQCRILYANFEIDRASCWQRFENVASARGILPGHENLKIWNLRGFNAPIEELIPKLIQDIGKEKYEAVIIDPLYKMYQSTRLKTFDENSAASLSYLFCEFDRMIQECGCALIMAGHYSKGQQGQKNSIDRTSGSGVLARDPDAIITLTELEATEGGYRLESVLRDFKSTDDISLRWEYPLHIIDPMLDGEGLKGAAGRKQVFNGSDLVKTFQKLDTGAGVTVVDICRELGSGSVNTIKRRIKELDDSGLNSIGLLVKGEMVLSTIQNHPK